MNIDRLIENEIRYFRDNYDYNYHNQFDFYNNIPTIREHYPKVYYTLYEGNFELAPFTLLFDNFDYTLTKDEIYMLLSMMRANYVCERGYGFVRALHFIAREHLPQLGEQLSQSGNHTHSFGEGLYCYRFDKVYEQNCDFSLKRVPTVLEGVCEYWKCVGSDDTPKDDELLIPPHHSLTLTHIIETKEELEEIIYLNRNFDYV